MGEEGFPSVYQFRLASWGTRPVSAHVWSPLNRVCDRNTQNPLPVLPYEPWMEHGATSISIHHLISFRGPAAGPTINESGDGVPQRLVSSRRDFLRRPVSINQYGAGLRNNFAPCHKRRPNRVWSSRMRLSAPCWRWPLETLAPPMRIGFFIFTSAPSTATLNSPPVALCLAQDQRVAEERPSPKRLDGRELW
ncbi:hypothetical protein TRIATDRAFT_85352 [Trichoderma atroviride IMI 206040]|uniref:Uncharacterized protein n=1 Tax=Hypocrea atroviridis (strain ATCC 20476 / IMI 206040) TaxID=452589 RepID=G9P7J2_HYPAI|nr:uncharacterized protein TRIATDRAFT_85352 [Trichoderma atroviride IMI 206040]EHK40803.1 hypothetical protein TRIATDRAFT_85352 [Trichoderma atroviride IMI 206040]